MAAPLSTTGTRSATALHHYRGLNSQEGQLDYEWAHLCRKVEQRDPPWFRAHLAASAPRPHPMFTLIPGPVAEWEIV